MGLMNDEWIIKQARKGMITPFESGQVSTRSNHLGIARKVISYGVSSYGYDMRVGNYFMLFTNMYPGVIDPKNFDDNVQFIDKDADASLDNSIIIPPNSFALARSVEYFKMPRDIMTICIGKSTYARCGIVVNVTAFEPEWEGNVTIEISNTTPLPAKIYAYEGIAQVIFFKADKTCKTSYADKKGKYQKQTGITLPKV